MERTRDNRTCRLATAALAAIALGLAVLATAPPAAAQDALDCEDFASQAEAQAAYREDPTDAADNDAGGDGDGRGPGRAVRGFVQRRARARPARGGGRLRNDGGSRLAAGLSSGFRLRLARQSPPVVATFARS